MKKLSLILVITIVTCILIGAGYTYMPWIANIGASSVGMGSTLNFTGGTVNKVGNTITVSGLDAGDNLGNHTATTALNMVNNAINNARSVTGSDLLLVAVDSARFEGDNSFWELNTGFTRLNIAGTNVLAWNNTDKTLVQLIPDNISGAISIRGADGNDYLTVTSTNSAPRMVIGSGEAGAAIGQQGIRYEDVQNITSTGSFTATKSTIGINLASTGTVTADVTGWPTSSGVASNICFINTDAVGAGVDVTIALTGATWHSGSNPTITPGQTVTAKLLNGVLYIQ